MIELTPGQELALTTGADGPDGPLRMGLGWSKERTAGAIGTGAPDIDLDATAFQFTGDQLFDVAFYNNLRTRDGSVVHLGDNRTGHGDGDDEVVTVDLARVHAPVDQVVFMVSSYHGHTLEWVSGAYCRLVGPDGVELARLTLSLGVPQTGLVMAKLVRDGGGWKLRAVGEGIDATQPTNAVGALRRFL